MSKPRGRRGSPEAREQPAPPTAREPPPYVDGAAARKAASVVTHHGPELHAAAPLPPLGPSLDLGDTRPKRSRRETAELARRTDAPPAMRRALPAAVPALPRGRLARIDGAALRAVLRRYALRTRSDVVDDFGLDPVYAERCRPILQALYRRYFRVEAFGMEHVPDHGRAMLVANHSGTLPYDAAMLMYALRYDHPAHRTARPLVEDFLFHFPFLGVTLNRIGCVRACQENAERLLLADQLAVVFPEGVKGIGKLYRERYQLQRFGRGGFIKLALRTRSPIIPVAVIGAEEIHPMLGRLPWAAKHLGLPYLPVTPTFPWLGVLGAVPLPTKWYIQFGEPVDLAGAYGPEAATDRVLVNRLTERVRSSIQGMMDQRLGQRSATSLG